jgi:hypothetical protein
MKISVLVPSEEYRTYAGARIRYGRLRPILAKIGIELDFADIGDFAPAQPSCDVLLISKCYDARSLILASALSGPGCLVGVDLFDDYFSQRSDSRLLRFRSWLKQLLPVCDFAFCSTPSMAELIGSYRENLPVHLVQDPADDLPIDRLSSTLSGKIRRVVEEGSIRLAWFGVGDNPNFRVGLSDLAAFGGILDSIRRSGKDVDLTVLTNRRALDARGLSLVRQLPVRTTIEEWTEARERGVLDYAFACFLPVNSQPFSAAKSLNRAVTALSAGCQVLSAGYPLYAPLGELIYRDVENFVTDADRGQMRLSVDSLDRLREILDAHASAAEEAHSLVRFLNGLTPSPNDVTPLGLIHGNSTTAASHKLVQSLQGFSIGTPFCTAELEFDIVFRRDAGRLIMHVSDRSAGRLRSSARGRLRKSNGFPGRNFWELPPDRDLVASETLAAEDAPLPLHLATYRSTMEIVRKRVSEAFGSCRFIVSENSPLPFDGALDASALC